MEANIHTHKPAEAWGGGGYCARDRLVLAFQHKYTMPQAARHAARCLFEWATSTNAAASWQEAAVIAQWLVLHPHKELKRIKKNYRKPPP